MARLVQIHKAVPIPQPKAEAVSILVGTDLVEVEDYGFCIRGENPFIVYNAGIISVTPELAKAAKPHGWEELRRSEDGTRVLVTKV